MAAPSNGRDGGDRLAHLLEGAATADIGDGVIDVSVGRLRIVLEQGGHRHDHAALAIAALRNVVVDPGLLHLVQRAVDGEAFDGGDLLAGGVADLHAAGACRHPVNMNGAGAALCNAATVFGAGQSGVFPDRPKQRRIRLDVEIDRFAVDSEVCHRVPLVKSNPSRGLQGDAVLEIDGSSNQDSALAEWKIIDRLVLDVFRGGGFLISSRWLAMTWIR